MRYLLISLLLLTACSASGPTFHDSAIPKTKEAVIVVYRDGGPLGIAAATYGIDLNGVPACKLMPNSFFVTENTGNTVISSSLFGSPGTSRIAFKADAGKVYFVKLNVNMDRASAEAFGGLVGALAHESTSEHSGPFIFNLVPADQAKAELATLHQDCI